MKHKPQYELPFLYFITSPSQQPSAGRFPCNKHGT
jgi:hypothetical protein